MDPGHLVASLATCDLAQSQQHTPHQLHSCFFLYKFAIETSRAPVKRVVQLKSAFVVCPKFTT